VGSAAASSQQPAANFSFLKISGTKEKRKKEGVLT
jgi:hypothetical protein